MSLAIVTFDIIEYLPSDFNFDSFSFIIASESRDFEQEISYLDKNQITHKAAINKKDLKYSIKTTKSGSLIGISDIIIPYSILSKKENIYDKTCVIAMSDSVRRVLFGSTSPSNCLKINIHITLQYKEKEKEKEKEKDKNLNRSNDKKEKDSKYIISGKKKTYERSESFGRGGEKKDGGTNSTFSQRNFGAFRRNGHLKQRSSSKPTSSMKSSYSMKPKTQLFINNNKLKEVQNDLLDNDQNEQKKKNKKLNDSFIDEELNNEVKEINPEFINYMKVATYPEGVLISSTLYVPGLR